MIKNDGHVDFVDAPMHVVHVVSSLDPRHGGPVTALMGLVEAQCHAGLKVSVLATWNSGDNLDLADRLRELKVNIELIGPCVGAIRWHREIGPTVRRALDSVQVVHIHAIWEEVLHVSARQSHRRHIPYLIRPCGMLDPWCLAQSRLKKRLYMALRLKRNLDHAAAIHFTTQEESCLTKPLRIKAPSIVEPNGIDLQEFGKLPDPGCFRRQLKDIGDQQIILFLSRLHPKKGLELLIPAFRQTNLQDTVLVIAGPADSPAYLQKLQSLVEANGLDGRVEFVGMLHGKRRIEAMVDADLFVLPSYQENFGVAVVEALATGTAVLISDQVNICSQVSDAKVGVVVPVDTASLATALKLLMSDEQLRRNAESGARDFVFRAYDWQHIAKRWKQHYLQMAAKS